MENKLTDEQFRLLKSKLQGLTTIQAEIGMLETRKHELLHDAANAKERLKDYQSELQKEYGDISVNMEDGTFTKPEE